MNNHVEKIVNYFIRLFYGGCKLNNGINKYGLKRYIPADVRRKVRYNSKQGCVLCRALFCQYHHFRPEFVDADNHNPDDICLLCPTHHDEVTRGTILNADISSAYQNTKLNDAIRPPFHQATLSGQLRLNLGNSEFDYMPNEACLLQYGTEKIFTVSYKESEVFGGSYPSISGSIFDQQGSPILLLDENTIVLASLDFDAEIKGTKILIRDNRSENSSLKLEITLIPPNGFQIDRLLMRHKDVLMKFDKTFGVRIPVGLFDAYDLMLPNMRASGADAIIAYEPWGRFLPATEFKIAGGEGVIGPFGITLARKAGRMLISEVETNLIK